jgi:hypothetical protein
MLAFFIWTFSASNYGETVHVTINGQEVSSPLLLELGGVAGFAVTMVVFLCVAILLLFIFAGIGMFLIGGTHRFGVRSHGVRVSLFTPSGHPIADDLHLHLRLQPEQT